MNEGRIYMVAGRNIETMSREELIENLKLATDTIQGMARQHREETMRLIDLAGAPPPPPPPFRSWLSRLFGL